MRLRIDRPCRVSQQSGGAWIWHCSLCTHGVLPFTGTAPDWQHAYTDADQHIRADHPPVEPHEQFAA